MLDILQERGRVNPIYLATFTYGRGLAGRQIPGQPFPDHGVQASDEAFFHGGNYARPHPPYYRDSILKDSRGASTGPGGARECRQGRRLPPISRVETPVSQKSNIRVRVHLERCGAVAWGASLE